MQRNVESVPLRCGVWPTAFDLVVGGFQPRRAGLVIVVRPRGLMRGLCPKVSKVSFSLGSKILGIVLLSEVGRKSIDSYSDSV